MKTLVPISWYSDPEIFKKEQIAREISSVGSNGVFGKTAFDTQVTKILLN
jgi:hypothetical protein